MTGERSVLEARARVHAALGDPARLAIVDHLGTGDASPGEIGRLLGLPTNLVAHHVAVLEAAGLVRRTRSEGDRRRTYLCLVPRDPAAVAEPRVLIVPRVVFVCTHNSARSQFAAALLAGCTPVPVASAGTAPAVRVHPRAVRVGRRHGLTLGRVRPAQVSDVVRADDLVIAVCDQAYERLGGGAGRLHWSVPDPVPADTDEAFEAAYAEIARRVGRLVPALRGGSRG